MNQKTVKILLVEDSEIHAGMIREALSSCAWGVNLISVRNLAEARATLAAASPDLAIIDLLLPDGKGTELLPPGREKTAYPVVIMTGHGNEEAAVEAMKAGALDYVVKSAATLADMPRIVERVLREWGHITERRQAEEALRQKRIKYQDLVETINDWVWEVDPNGVYTYASPNVRNLLGYEPEEVLGKTPFDLMPEFEAARVAKAFQDLAEKHVSFSALQNINRHKDGHYIVLETSGVPFFDEDDTFLGYRGVDRDITERKEAEERLKEANRELDAFAYTVSHDLRTPLTAILGFAELFGEEYRGVLDEKGLDILAGIRSQGERMLAMMEDLLALAKVGHLERPAEPVETDEVVREVLEELGSHLASVGLAVQRGPLPALHVPRTLLVQVFENLIGNAHRYAGKEGGTIEVGGERMEERVRFYVRDHGPGIPAEERGRIFEVFYRGSTGKKLQGTGIGLAIVHKIASLYGGRAWAEETAGGGSTFWVEMTDARPAEKERR